MNESADQAIKEAIERLHIAVMQHYNTTKHNRTNEGTARLSRICDQLGAARQQVREGIE